ncbi:MAG: hypothetical protein ACC742_14430, partial [Thermoanaerobaculales bacterium]
MSEVARGALPVLFLPRANLRTTIRSTPTTDPGFSNDNLDSPSLALPLCGLFGNRSMMEEPFFVEI